MTRLLVGLVILVAALIAMVERAAPAQAAPALSSVTVTEQVTGGGGVTISITLTSRAASSTRVTLTSSNRAALPTGSSVTVASGRSTASVTLNSVPVPRATAVTVTAKLAGVAMTDKVTVLPPALASVRLPASVGGGLTVEGTVTLTGRAPSGGILVALKGNRPSRMTLPASVRVASGRTTARFTVTAAGEPDADVTVTGRLGVTKADVIRVTALTVRVELPARVFADVPVSGRVLLNGTAPAGGAGIPVDLTVNIPTTTAPPASVTIQPGTAAATFGLTAPLVAPSDANGLTAQVRGRTSAGSRAFRQLVIESNIGSLSVEPARRGATTTGVIRLQQAYPTAVNVALTLSDPSIATVPATVRLLPGQTTATFDLRLERNGVTRLTAMHKSSLATRQVEVGITGGFAGDAARVYPGVTTSVRLEIRPLPYAVTLQLQSSDPSVVAFTATTVTLPAGGDGAIDLPIQAKALGTVTLSASYDGVTLSESVTADHIVRRIDLLDPPALGTVDAQLTMAMTRTGSYTVALSSNSAAISVPATVTVPAGRTDARFTITIAALGSADITATYGGVTRTLTVATGIAVQALAIQGAYIGAEATGLVTLSGDVAAPTVVELFAENPSIVDVPATVTVPAGADQAVFPITGTALGTTTVSARLHGYGRSATVTTTGLIASVEAPAALMGLPATGRVTIAAPQSGPVVVALASSAPTVATVPATVTIPASASSAEFPITAHQAGTPRITAGFGGVSVAVDLTVSPLFDGISAGPSHIAGEVETATLHLSLPSPQDLAVTLASSAPSVATVPATMTILEGESSGALPVTNVAAGKTEITATFGDQTATIDWTVVAPRLASVTVSDAYVGLEATGVVTLEEPAASAVLVSLQEGGGDLLTVPDSVTVPTGQTSMEFSFLARGTGDTVIQASIPGEAAREAPVTVVQIVADLELPNAFVGEPATGTVTLVAPAPVAFDVQLGSSQPEIATVPGTLTAPAGSASVDVPITAVGAGTTRITVTFGDFELVRDLTVTERATLADLLLPPLYAGLRASGQVRLVPTPGEATVVQLTSSAPGVATVPATVTASAGDGYGSFVVTAIAEGTTTITATLNGVTLTRDVTVGNFIQDIDEPTLYPAVEGQQVVVSFAAPAPGPLTLGVSSDSAIVTVPPTVGVGLGALEVAVPITVSGSGSFTLTITLNGAAYAEALTVSPLLASAACTACPVVEGRDATATVRLNAAPSSTISVAMSSDEPAVASVPAGVAVAAGSSSGEFSVSANSPGTATITASWNGESVTLVVEVVADTQGVRALPSSSATKIATATWAGRGPETDATAVMARTASSRRSTSVWGPSLACRSRGWAAGQG